MALPDALARAGAALAALWLCAARAAAEPPTVEDSRQLFDEPAPRPQPPALDCSALGPFGCVFATDPDEPFAPAAVGTRLGAAWLADLPQSDATHDRLATLAAGTARDPYGLTVAGASSIEDRWLVDGAPADDARFGGAGTRVPLLFLDTIAVTTGGFAARDRASTGAIIDAQLRRGGPRRELLAAAWLTAGAPARAIDDANYVPVTGDVGPMHGATAAVVADGPAGPGWYFVGVQAHVQPFTFTGTARRLVDRNDDGVPDRDPSGLVTETIATRDAGATVFDVPFVARAGATRGPHDLALTLVGDWSGDTSFDPMATLSAGAIDLRRLTGDAIATYRGRWAQTRALVQAAWHHDARTEAAHDPAAAAIPQLATAFVPNGALLPDDFALGVGCDDAAAADPYPLITDCPMPRGYFSRGGAGLLTDAIGDRPSVTASIARRFGEHRVEIGATGEDARLVVNRRYTGGYLERSIFGGDRIDSHFVELGDGAAFPDDCAGASCRFVDTARSTYRSREAATWVEETWRPDPSVAADVGMRWEWQHLGGTDPLHQLLPRAGLAWDPLGGGRSRIYAGFARTVPLLPGRLAETIAGGPAQLTTVNLGTASSDFLHEVPAVRVAIGTSPMVVDDVTVGGEVVIAQALRVGAAGEWRTLRRALDSDGTLITNPSVPALRDAGTFTFQLATAPGGPVSLRLAYTYARAFGTWTGPADPSLGATYYDGPDFAGAPPVGDLPSDLRHRLIAEVVTTRRVGAYALIVSGRAIAASGHPIGAVDGAGSVILARGTLGRTPPATAADIRVALRRGAFEAGVDVVNVFDHRPTAFVDERYTTDAVRPIGGGDASDLVFLRGDDGSVPTRDPNFGRPTAALAPLTATLYARAAF